MSTEPAPTEENIRKPIARFTNSFDLEDWVRVEPVLGDLLTVDY